MKSIKLCLIAAACSGAIFPIAPAWAQTALPLDIEAKPMSAALTEIAQQTGANILFPPEAVRGLRSISVRGRFSPLDAARRAVVGTALEVTQDRSGAIIIRNARTQNFRPAALAVTKPRPAPTSRAATPVRLAEPEPPINEITVTARKRQESILKVPVIETVISQETLQNYQITDFVSVSTKVPGLLIGNGPLAIGPQVSIRGVGTTAQDAGVDQSVSLNLDGLSMGQGLAFRAGLFDLSAIEVLKGPQALFYGKASTGGVISLRTADPGDKLEIIARAGYELEADEKRGELIVSTPVGDTLGVRLAGSLSKAKGFFHNRAIADPNFGGLTPKYSRNDNSESYILRGTVVWKPSPKFDARLKVNLTREEVQGNAAHLQMSSCPEGTGAVSVPQTAPAPPRTIPFLSPLDNCKVDRNTYWVDLDPAAFPGIRNNGVPFFRSQQKFGTLEMNYRPVDDVTLTSVTGYYRLKTYVFINTTQSGSAAPFFVTDNDFRRRDFSQEFRLDSDFDAPLNVALGAFYQDGQLSMIVDRFINQRYVPNPVPKVTGSHDVDIKTYAAFGQLRWKPAVEVEIAGGVRYTDEKRSDDHRDVMTGASIPLAVNEISAKNWSPEFSVTYSPNDDLTLFGSLKQAYKSGSFTLTQRYAAGFDNSFGDEKVRGGEIGLKARLADRSLFVNLAAYLYKYQGLQVGINALNPATGLTLSRTLNAGGAKVYGLDFDFNYRPRSIEGLTLHGSVNYVHGRFTDLEGIPCWGGQLISEGCNQIPNAAQRDPVTGLPRFTAQNLDGLPLTRAPDWQAIAGVEYEMPVGRGMKLSFGADGIYSSKFSTILSRRPDAIKRSYFIANANVALKSSDDEWEMALIGNNLGNKITWSNCTHADFAVGAVGGGVISGATVRGPAGIAETACAARRGREVWLRLTWKPAS